MVKNKTMEIGADMIPHLFHLPFMFVPGDSDEDRDVELQRHLNALSSRSNSESDTSAYATDFVNSFDSLVGFEFYSWLSGENKAYVIIEIDHWLEENSTLQEDEIEIMAQDIYDELRKRTQFLKEEGK